MKRREPNFDNVLKLLRREITERPVLFELFMNMPLYELVNGEKLPADDDLTAAKFTVKAFAAMGYDYATLHASHFHFPTNHKAHAHTLSLNDDPIITDERTFEQYTWPDPEQFDTSVLSDVKRYLPDGMKLMVMSPGGVLENVIELTGYDNLCYMLYEQPELAGRLFDEVGNRLLRYYELALQHDSVGFVCANDDWGFNTQTLLSPAQMRQFVFPHHRRIVDLAHQSGRPVILHSCGNFRDIIDDTIALGFDAKHSYEDNILPIERAYDAWHDRIALLGGIDLHFLCTSTEDAIRARTRALLEQTAPSGGWAVGTGNSVPEYLPPHAFFAMLEAAIGYSVLPG